MSNTIQVLHVDDEPSFGDLVATFLEKENEQIEVISETSAEDGLETLYKENIECVVSDYDMPRKTGLEFLERVRQRNPDIPFILFTGKGSEEIASQAISAGATDYLQKGSGTDQYKVLANRITNAYERLRTQQDLVETTELYETMLSNISETVLVTDSQGEFTYISPNVHFVFGYSKPEVEEFKEVAALFDEQLFDEEELQAEGEISNVETEITHKSGERVTVLVTVKQVSIQNGTRLYTVRDITDRKERQRKLQQSQAEYESLTDDVLDTSDIGTFILNSEFEIVWINEAIEEYFGIYREEVLGADKRRLIQSEIEQIFEDPTRFTETVLATYGDNTYTEEFECHVLAGDGREERWLNHWSQPITSGIYEGGRIEHYTDITERKQREQDLEQKERRYQAILNDPNILVGLLDTDGTLREVNETAMTYVDPDLDAIVGEPFWETPWWADEIQPVIQDKIEQAATGEYVEYSAELTTPNDEPYSVQGVIRPVTDDNDTVRSLIVSARDVTE